MKRQSPRIRDALGVNDVFVPAKIFNIERVFGVLAIRFPFERFHICPGLTGCYLQQPLSKLMVLYIVEPVGATPDSLGGFGLKRQTVFDGRYRSNSSIHGSDKWKRPRPESEERHEEFARLD
mgnify:CR=1 FL=1